MLRSTRDRELRKILQARLARQVAIVAIEGLQLQLFDAISIYFILPFFEFRIGFVLFVCLKSYLLFLLVLAKETSRSN